MIQVKRAYEAANREDGARFLVERLWPRGIKKENLKLDDWLKDIAPSTDLRRWFNHDPARWDEFRRRYFTELVQHPKPLQRLLASAKSGRVTLVYSAHDTEHNNAVALKEYLEKEKTGTTEAKTLLKR